MSLKISIVSFLDWKPLEVIDMWISLLILAVYIAMYFVSDWIFKKVLTEQGFVAEEEKDLFGLMAAIWPVSLILLVLTQGLLFVLKLVGKAIKKNEEES